MEAGKGSGLVLQKLALGTSSKSPRLNESVMRQLGRIKRARQDEKKKNQYHYHFSFEYFDHERLCHTCHQVNGRPEGRLVGERTQLYSYGGQEGY